jgi:hypothetical protein
MSSDYDPVAGFVLALLAMVVVLPVAVAVCLLVVGGRSLVWLAHRGQDLVQGPPVERELRRIARERNQAIRDIVALKHSAERELREIAREGSPKRRRR